MSIDIRTLTLILGAAQLVQIIVFYHQFKVNKSYPGIGWWLAWSCAEVIGFMVMLLRNRVPGLQFIILDKMQQLLPVWYFSTSVLCVF